MDAMPDPPATPLRRSRAGCLGGPLLALASLLFTLVLVEAGLRLFHPLPDPYAEGKRRLARGIIAGSPYVPSAFPANSRRTFAAEPGLPGMAETPVRFTTNAYGYRGGPLAMPRPAGELRVFVVGGSTVECIFLDDTAAVTAVLERRLAAGRTAGRRPRVYGAGKSGDRSYDHVAMVAHRIVHLQPDVVVVLAGVNDLAAGIAGRDYLLFSPTRGREADPGSIITRFGMTELQTGRALYWGIRRFAGRSDEEAPLQVSGYRSALARQRALPATERPPPTDVAPYERNLATLAGIARAQGFRLVFATQGTTWNSPDPGAAEWHWMTGDTVRYREDLLDAAMERYNDAMRRVGAAQGVPVFDLARALPKTLDYYYDDVHFNARGADTTATLLARFLAEQGLMTP